MDLDAVRENTKELLTSLPECVTLVAIEEGASMVRIGTWLFDPR